jgi:hypothetical protein
MSSNKNKLTPHDPYIHVTFNIVANRSDSFVSIIATHRTPSDNEVKRANWTATLKRGRAVIHVVGKGDRLSDDALKDYARAYCDPAPKRWLHVDLSALDMPPRPDPPPLYSWLDDDPAWRMLRELANEVTK